MRASTDGRRSAADHSTLGWMAGYLSYAAVGTAAADDPAKLAECLVPACSFWEIWMGMLVGLILAARRPASSSHLPIASSPCRISRTAMRRIPCRCTASGSSIRAACSMRRLPVFFGLTLLGAATWLLWELWSVAEPRPITDDFLRLLNDSFGRDWRNPLKWPWARLAVGVWLHARRCNVHRQSWPHDLDARYFGGLAQDADDQD